MTMRDELIEAAARAIGKAMSENEESWRFFTPEATAALDAILARLAEPDEAMVEAYNSADLSFVESGWRAMLATLRADDGGVA